MANTLTFYKISDDPLVINKTKSCIFPDYSPEKFYLLNKAISEMTDGEYLISESNCLYNISTKEKYASDVLLINTNIRNGTKLVLL